MPVLFFTKPTCLLNNRPVSLADVTIGTIGTHPLGRPGMPDPSYPWSERVPPPGRDATLLAVVPIPGTGTSLAIVGYAISTSSPERVPAAAAPAPGPRSRPGLAVDRLRRRAWADGRELALTFLEFELLAFLTDYPDTVFSRADLADRVWRRGAADATAEDRAGGVRGRADGTGDTRRFAAGSRTVDVHISRLRHKLGPVYGACLVTEHRAGYCFRPPPL
jgi:Transcriptional regulatory protein, C terminal